MADMKLGLTRGDFNQHSVVTFQALLQDSAFNDVTLVCEDQRQVKGHKVILSSGSKLFKEILLKNPHPNPLIYLKLTYDHLNSIVRFIYLGQCEVDQSDIDNFLATAQDLLIEGLYSEKGNKMSQSKPQSNVNERIDITENTPNTNSGLEEYSQGCEFSLQEEKTDNTETISHPESVTKIVKEEQYVENLSVAINEDFSCPDCGKIEFCEAALVVHKRKDHNVQNIEIMQTEPKKILSDRTKLDRKRDFNHFQTYVSIQTGTSINQIINGKDGHNIVEELFFGYFSSFRNQNGEIPSISYICKLKSSINSGLIEKFKLDMTIKERFPNFHYRWQVVISGLYISDKSCKQCNIDFTDNNDLRHHMIIHQARSSQTIIDRNKYMTYFEKYVFEKAGMSIGTIISCENGRNNIIDMFFSFLSRYRNKDGNIPSVHRLKRIKSSISCKLKEKHSLDLFTGEFHKEITDRWKDINSELYDKFNCTQCRLEFIDDITLKSHLETHNKVDISNIEELANKGDIDIKKQLSVSGDISNIPYIP